MRLGGEVGYSMGHVIVFNQGVLVLQTQNPPYTKSWFGRGEEKICILNRAPDE